MRKIEFLPVLGDVTNHNIPRIAYELSSSIRGTIWMVIQFWPIDAVLKKLIYMESQIFPRLVLVALNL